MKPSIPLLLAGLVLVGSPLRGQGVVTTPNLGYLYPAGGRRGSTVEVLAGGQRLVQDGQEVLLEPGDLVAGQEREDQRLGVFRAKRLVLGVE